jgi:hypothetical protein
MILIIRGHIRNSFESIDLYNFVEKIYNMFPDLKIFIHTWNIFANNISWRQIKVDTTIVNEDIIYKYFGKLSSCIKHIIIDDDKNIELIGNLNGTINNGIMPIIGWKNYWYGKYKIIDYLYNIDYLCNKNICDDEIIINYRFDIFNNSNNFVEENIIHFIKMNSNITFTKNVFMFDNEYNTGIDNIYIGNIHTMHKLIHKFFYELDDILSIHNDVYNQERLVYRINSIIFD